MPYLALAGRDVLELACQYAVLLLLLPGMLWLGEEAPALLAGRSVAPVRERYGQFLSFCRDVLRHGLPGEDGLMLALVLLVLPGLAGLSFQAPAVGYGLGSWLGDPLLAGCVLLAGGLWAVPGRGWLAHGRCALVLCLTESFLVLAAPGVTGLLGVHRLLLAMPGSSLAGVALCCALALALSSSLPDSQMLAEGMMARRHPACRKGRDRRQVILSLYHAGWALLLGDIFMPVLFGLGGAGGVAALLVRYGGGLILLAAGRVAGAPRQGRLVALLLGLAGLMALAGRFAA